MDYQLKSVGKTCVRTGTELRPGDACYSALVERANAWVRLDFSPAAWNGPPEGAIGYWKTIVPQPGEAKHRTLDPDSLLRQFEQLCEEANPARETFRYVLALLLVQRRRLRIEGTRSDGEAAFLQLAGLAGEGPFEVREQNLDASEIEAIQRELNEAFTEPSE